MSGLPIPIVGCDWTVWRNYVYCGVVVVVVFSWVWEACVRVDLVVASKLGALESCGEMWRLAMIRQ